MRWALAVAVLLVVTAACSSGSGKAPQAAIDACHAATLDKLVVPSSAAFDADAAPKTKATGDGMWAVAGTVDSQNRSSGGTVRNVYSCVAAKSQKPPPDYLGFIAAWAYRDSVPDGVFDGLDSSGS